MNVIAKISCYLERGVVTLKSRKEYLNSVTHTTLVLLRIKNWTVWYIERYCMSTYTGVTNCQNTVRLFWPTLYMLASLLVCFLEQLKRTALSGNRLLHDIRSFRPTVTVCAAGSHYRETTKTDKEETTNRGNTKRGVHITYDYYSCGTPYCPGS